ncbi:helix-turn-helix domain-containing protein [Micromonospora carbonacea]|uniref:helix-turn-helix domain-containing protein n=1 Tax=Micromonospora carbonacea TaxID=47853 RepID=UPI0009F2457F|nr:helix-turn-helix domain-containing protein [Micromonospora carbonacea]
MTEPNATQSTTGTTTAPTLLQKPTISVVEAGKVLGIGRGAAYEAARRGQIPTIKIGQRLRVPTARLLAILNGDSRQPQS